MTPGFLTPHGCSSGPGGDRRGGDRSESPINQLFDLARLGLVVCVCVRACMRACACVCVGCSVRTWTPVRGFIHTDTWNGCDSRNAAAPSRVRCVRAAQISYCFFVAMVTTAASFCVPTAALFLAPCVCERASVSVCARLWSCPRAPVLKMPAEDLRAHCFHQSSRLVFSKLAPLPPQPHLHHSTT